MVALMMPEREVLLFNTPIEVTPEANDPDALESSTVKLFPAVSEPQALYGTGITEPLQNEEPDMAPVKMVDVFTVKLTPLSI